MYNLRNKKVLIIGGAILVLVAIILSIILIFNTKPETYTIQFQNDDGTIEEQVVKEGESAVIPEEPTKEGYRFVGWKTPDGETYDFSQQPPSSSAHGAGVTLIPEWVEEQPDKEYITVRFNTSGGTTIANQVIEKGQTVKQPKDPVKSGYKFVGWAWPKGTFKFDTPLSENTIISALWKPVTTTSASATTKPSSSASTKPSSSASTKPSSSASTKPSSSASTKPSTSTTNPNNQRNVIHFISTGQSDAILIESYGKYGLIDSSNPCSSNPYNDRTNYATSIEKESVAHVVEYLKNMKIKYLDFVVATHSHSDHIGGMPEIAKNFVNSKTTYYYRPYDNADDEHEEWDNDGYYERARDAMIEAKAKLVDVTGKTTEYTYNKVKIKFFNTDRSKETYENMNSIGVLVTCGNKKVFLASDIEDADANKIASTVGKVDILKMNHHGYSGTTQQYLSKLQPKYIVMTNRTTSVPEQASAAIAYAKEKYATTVYVTGGADPKVTEKYSIDSIKVKLTSDNFTFLQTPPISLTITTTGWIKWSDKWVYLDKGKLKKGWYPYAKNGKWYYLDSNGFAVTGWKSLEWKDPDSGKPRTDWFYFDPGDGYMYTGWQYLKESGKMNHFYFDLTHGYMYKGWHNLDWKGGRDRFYFDPSDGHMHTGWEEINYKGKKRWFFFDFEDGYLNVSGWHYLPDDNGKYYKWYYLDSEGYAYTGWHELKYKNGSKTGWFYFDDSNAHMLTGWQKLTWSGGTNYFYFDLTDGFMYKNTTKTIDGKSYKFNADGVCTSTNLGC